MRKAPAVTQRLWWSRVDKYRTRVLLKWTHYTKLEFLRNSITHIRAQISYNDHCIDYQYYFLCEYGYDMVSYHRHSCNRDRGSATRCRDQHWNQSERERSQSLSAMFPAASSWKCFLKISTGIEYLAFAILYGRPTTYMYFMFAVSLPYAVNM